MSDDSLRPGDGPAAPSPSSFSPNQSASFTEPPKPASDLKNRVREDMAAAQDSLKSSAENAAEKAKSAASGQVSYVARQMQGVADALQKAGAELEGSDQAEVGRYTRQVGQSVQGLAKQMEGKDIGEIASLAEAFGRRQPLAFLGMAALAGLTASRFLTASAHRSTEEQVTASDTPRDTSMTVGVRNV
jgi:hypothetical protein